MSNVDTEKPTSLPSISAPVAPSAPVIVAPQEEPDIQHLQEIIEEPMVGTGASVRPMVEFDGWKTHTVKPKKMGQKWITEQAEPPISHLILREQ